MAGFCAANLLLPLGMNGAAGAGGAVVAAAAAAGAWGAGLALSTRGGITGSESHATRAASAGTR
jgi:hypothetical protein